MKLSVPAEPAALTLEQVQMSRLLDKREDMTAFAKKVHSVAIMCNASPQDVGKITLDDLDRVYDRLFHLVNGVENPPLKRIIKILGREYGFIEDVRDMETGAFVDIDQMCQDGKYDENLHKIMAILYRPIDAKLRGRYRLKSYVKESLEDRKERQLIFLKHMTLEEVKAATAFFLLVTQRCCGISDGSFPQVRSLTVEEVIRGAGITLSTTAADESSEISKPRFKRASVKQ